LPEKNEGPPRKKNLSLKVLVSKIDSYLLPLLFCRVSVVVQGKLTLTTRSKQSIPSPSGIAKSLTPNNIQDKIPKAQMKPISQSLPV
jgi:hypothetical protein